MIIFNIIQPPLDLFIFSNISVKTGKTRAKLACTPIQCGFLHLNKPTLRFIIENKEWSGLSWSILKGQSEWITISSPFVFMFCFFFFVAFNEWKCGGEKKKKSLISSAGILSIVCKVQYRCSVSGAYLCNMLTARGDVIYLPGPLSLAKIIISCIRSQQSLEKNKHLGFYLIKTATSGSTRFVLFICSRFFHLCVNATLFPLGVKLTQTYTS